MDSILTTTPTTTRQISSGERWQQTFVIGANGTGKSTHLLHNILSDINNGCGVCVLDPHGDLLKDVISRMEYRLEDVVLLSITNPDLPFGLNLFHCPKPLDPIAVQNTVSMILNIFEKVYGVDRNTMARIINYLQALIYLFIHNPDLTVLDIPDVLDPSKESEMLRLRLVQNLPRSPAYNYTRYFWTKYYNQRGYFGRDEELAGIFNKFREMTSVLMWPVFCQKNTIDFSTLMSEKKIVLCKLNSDWPDVTSLVGSILIGQILHAGYIRRHTQPFYVYCDEFQNFATYDFARLFAEARKFNIAMTIAHQTETQVEVNIREVCKQAGNLIVFRVTAKDSAELAQNFDNTPPPGEWIYEKQMRRASKPYEVEYWDPPKAEEEYTRLTEQIAAIGKQLPKRISELKIKLPLIKGSTPNSAVTYRSEFAVSVKTSREIGHVMTPELWKIAEKIMYWFQPFAWDNDVESYLKSLFEVHSPPLHFEKRYYQWEGYRKKTVLRKMYTDYNYYVKIYRTDFSGKQHPDEYRLYKDTKQTHFQSGGFQYLAIRQQVQANMPYSFPAYLPSRFEVEDAENTLALPLRNELAAMYASLKPHARYYFDVDTYNKLLLGQSYDIRYGSHENTLHPHHFMDIWKGPYFRSDADWLFILKWIANKYLDVDKQQTNLQRLKQRQEELLRTCFKKETRTEWLDWYEPVPVQEKEYLEARRAWARAIGEEFIIGDNCKYKARQGAPLYTSAEVEARIANKLAHLPNYTACIKTPSNEFAVTTLPPGMAASEFEFRRRVRFIQHNNLRLGYVRKREDVEQEFMEREPLVPDLSYQPNQPRHPSHANTMVVPPLPQSRKKKRRETV